MQLLLFFSDLTFTTCTTSFKMKNFALSAAEQCAEGSRAMGRGLHYPTSEITPVVFVPWTELTDEEKEYLNIMVRVTVKRIHRNVRSKES